MLQYPWVKLAMDTTKHCLTNPFFNRPLQVDQSERCNLIGPLRYEHRPTYCFPCQMFRSGQYENNFLTIL